MSAARQCLVTGASGFIGGHLVRALAGRGARITALGRGEAPAPGIAPYVERWIRTDLARRADVEAAASEAAGARELYHLAGSMEDAPGLDDLERRYFAEVVAPLVLADLLGPSLEHVAYFSSTAVYGPAPGPCAEDSPLAPAGLYGTNKAVLEDAFGLFSRVRKKSLSVLRVAAVYGPGMSRGSAAVRFLERICRGERPRITGPAEALRDYVHVGDVVDAALAAVQGRKDGTWNVASSAPVGLAGLARAAARALGSDLEPEIVGGATGTDKLYANDKARRDLGLAPRSLEDGLRDMAAREGFACTS